VIDTVLEPSAHADDPSIFNGDVEATTVRAEHARGLDPTFDLALRYREVRVNALRPLLPQAEGRRLSPNPLNPIHGPPRAVDRITIYLGV
jgi:hypothetical protein